MYVLALILLEIVSSLLSIIECSDVLFWADKTILKKQLYIKYKLLKLNFLTKSSLPFSSRDLIEPHRRPAYFISWCGPPPFWTNQETRAQQLHKKYRRITVVIQTHHDKKQTQFNNFCRALRVACVTSLADLPRNEILLSVRLLSILHVRGGDSWYSWDKCKFYLSLSGVCVYVWLCE